MRTLFVRLDALDLEFDPVAFFKMMNASVESQEEFERILGIRPVHIISREDIILVLLVVNNPSLPLYRFRRGYIRKDIFGSGSAALTRTTFLRLILSSPSIH